MKNCALGWGVAAIITGAACIVAACSSSDDAGTGSSSSSSSSTSSTSSTSSSTGGPPDASSTSSSSSSSSSGSSGDTHATPTGFDSLKATSGGPGGGSLAVDGSNRLWGFESINQVYYIDDTGTEVKVDPIPVAAGKGCKAGSVNTGPDGSVYASCAPGPHVFKHPAGDGAWTELGTGLPSSEFTTYTGGVGFDATGNMFTLTADINASTFQLYKLPTGTTAWASTGPALKETDGASFPPRRLVVDADGTVYVIAGKLFKLASGGSAWEKAIDADTADILHAKDGSIYAQTGAGNGQKVVKKAAGGSTFDDVTAMAAGGFAGLCQTGAGDIYAGTYNMGVLWKLGGTAFATVTFDQTGFTAGQVGIACAPNGRVWLVGTDGLHRSKP